MTLWKVLFLDEQREAKLGKRNRNQFISVPRLSLNWTEFNPVFWVVVKVSQRNFSFRWLLVVKTQKNNNDNNNKQTKMAPIFVSAAV